MSDIFIIDADSFEKVKEQLNNAKTEILRNLDNARVGQRDVPHIANDIKSEVKKDPTCFAVIISGYSLVSNSASWRLFCFF